ncbi:MAG: tetratricopeptide repeat protein [Nitrospirae bacterium]|nr:tetratricopeptide repeat protein [Nitrospirota bacterium]
MNYPIFRLGAVALLLSLIVFLPIEAAGASAADKYFNRAIKYMDKGEFDKAVADFTKALKINPYLAEAYYNLGLIFGKEKHDYENAIVGLSRAVQLNPKYAEAHNSLGEVYRIGKKDYDKAVAEYSEAIKIKKDFAEAYYNRGIAFFEGTKEYDNATADYTKALEINSNFAAAYYNRAIVYMTRGDKTKGCGDIARACELGMCEYAQHVKSTGECK